VKAKLEEAEEENDDNKLHYGLEDTPPWYTCLVLGFQVSRFCLHLHSQKDFAIILQHYITFVVGIVSVPVVMCPKLCMLEDDAARGELVSTLIFVSGLVTILQTTIGVRYL
jgi:solute carrier family 23 (nucleobase transporter), member 1